MIWKKKYYVVSEWFNRSVQQELVTKGMTQ